MGFVFLDLVSSEPYLQELSMISYLELIVKNLGDKDEERSVYAFRVSFYLLVLLLLGKKESQWPVQPKLRHDVIIISVI